MSANENTPEGQVVLPDGRIIYAQNTRLNFNRVRDTHMHINNLSGNNAILTPGNELDTLLAAMNGIFHVIRSRGGKSCVLMAKAKRMKHLRFTQFEAMTVGNFRSAWGNITVLTNPEEEENKHKYVPLSSYWYNRTRNFYTSIGFYPGEAPSVDGNFNLWRGFGYAPKHSDWSLMAYHIREVLAGGNKEYAEYILNWAAFTLQNLNRKAEVALVFRGNKGNGKGTFANALVALFGIHAMHVTSSQHVTGRFNSHMQDKKLIFADEALAPDDRQAEAVLKGLITENVLAVEAKGVDIMSDESHVNLVMAANQRTVVPATLGERRFACFDVSDKHKQDHAYFGRLNEQMEAGGYEAMLYDLLMRPLANWHPRSHIPMTAALREQMFSGMSSVEQFVLYMLEMGTLPTGTVENARTKELQVPVSCRGKKEVEGLEEAYGSFCKLHGIGRKDKNPFTKELKTIFENIGFARKRVRQGPLYLAPLLSEARYAWDMKYQPYPWDDGGEWSQSMQWEEDGSDGVSASYAPNKRRH
ncbi:DUF5906 domain-containing protein [Salipiger mangrovisoli]|uniref:NrS-1 polymerase-like helicase domain-containing protein n=1 Tax=Salipiger mangrovisoli TaxID=2865933 RepID=A0ABR9X442_9RHOB|nr:DUF5906 domain-containing protein [Salipiger mangrovisoli]MBE9638282.1 hypothetical protein [Salipiger mangrovisoli]